MKNRYIIYNIYALALLLLSGCSEVEDLPRCEAVNSNEMIRVGGLSTAELSVQETMTRANGVEEKDAETIDWLVSPLMSGLDITYGNLGSDGTEHNKHVAILKLLTNDDGTIKYSEYKDENGATQKLAEYSFLYKTTEGTGADAVTKDERAKWYDNGFHFFEGVYVPGELRNNGTSKPDDLTTNQSGNNYTYLERYLAMPANHHIAATISRIRLPFKHRLSRVLAYVLIDPAMGEGVTIRGYKKNAAGNNVSAENPTTSEIRFCKVKVLSGVEEKANGELMPKWSEAVRKVIPHYVGENAGVTPDGSIIEGTEFVMYHHKKRDEYLAPSSDGYAAAAAAYASRGDASEYEKLVYKNAPCYDLIVEPSYSDREHVMYDEEGYYNTDGTVNDTKVGQLAAIQNMIEFEITLSNGLQYTKVFHFNDLDANFQTVVYLRISKESVDYDNSGAILWNNKVSDDGYYGVNNQNGNVLSDAGGSWQRAFRIKTVNYPITDGSNYNEDSEDDYDSNKDGQYVSKANWVKAFAQAVAGGVHHGDYFVLDDDITIDATMLPDNFEFTGHLDGRGHKIMLTHVGEQAYKAASSLEGLYTKSGETYTSYNVPEHLYEQVITPAELYTYDEYKALDGKSETTEEEFNALSDADKTKTPATTTYPEVTITLDVLLHGSGLYTDDQGTNPFANPTALYQTSHTSNAYLFAGLNGNYDAAVGEANVHQEGSYLVPLKGYRAELLNIIFGCTPFADGASITGYINNCKLTDGTSVDNDPGIPEYK